MDVRVESPFPPYAWPRVWTWMQQFRTRVADDFSPSTLEEYVETQMHRMHPGLNWGVYRGGDLGGAIWFEPGSPVSGIIHTVFRKDFWGHDTTQPALTKAFEDIFAAGNRKLLAMCFADNHSVRGMAKRLGMKQEGLLTGLTLRRGEPTDMVICGITREEFYGNRSRNSDVDKRATERGSGSGKRTDGQEEDIDRKHRPHPGPVIAAVAGQPAEQPATPAV